MQVFILCTGRSGSSTFIKACKCITNFSSGHETRIKKTGDARFAFPENHIEADNRLSWFLGALENKYGNSAFYVHLIRNREATINSFNSRWKNKGSIVKAFSESILYSPTLFQTKKDKKEICSFYVDTVNTNIEMFLKNKTHKMIIHLEKIEKEFPQFWNAIHAEGDLKKATSELRIKHNRS
ncbi:MAG: hypothetical protein IPN31_05030 [Bacteroidetes bacterium]|nr:hypothetical protein [Bacteroidota bacterium]